MEKVTEADFDKVRKLVALSGPFNGSTTEASKLYAAKRQAFEEARPAATFLIDYYYTVVQPDDGVRNHPGTGDRPYSLTKKERALLYIKNYDGPYGITFMEKYPNLLEDAIQHYKAEAKKRLNEAKKQTLKTMTGEQLLLILGEHKRQQKEGVELTMPVENGGITSQVYKNSYETLASIEEFKEDEESGAGEAPAEI